MEASKNNDPSNDLNVNTFASVLYFKDNYCNRYLIIYVNMVQPVSENKVKTYHEQLREGMELIAVYVFTNSLKV